MIEIDGVPCHIECSGQGQAVVLLHGWGQNLSMMRFIHHQLQDRYRVLSLDLPGFGESRPLPPSWQMDDYPSFLHRLLIHYQIESPVLIAHSFGARIAIQYACSYPVSCMVLTGAAGIRAPLSFWKKSKQHLYRLCRHLPIAARLGSEDYRSADPVLKNVLVQSVNKDLTPSLSAICCPILLVWGANDRQTPLWMGRRMEEHFPNARLLVYEDDDHFAYYHQGFRFVEDVRQFLEVNA